MRLVAWVLVVVGALAATARAAEPAGPLVSAEWLAARLGDDQIRVLDIRNGIDGGSAAAFALGHVPGAVYSNYLEAGWRTAVDGVPGMTPRIEALEALIGGLGIDNDSHVVIVHGGIDASDFSSAARVYWTFAYLGHPAVSILDGGWRGWTQSPGRPIETGVAAPAPALFVAAPRPELLIDTGAVAATLDDPRVVRLDARPAAQFFGLEKAGPARAPGRLPDAVGVEQAVFFSPDGRLKRPAEITALLPEQLTDSRVETVVSYCNTGHWAATNWFVLSELLGRDDVRLYDASMVGWTADPQLPLETGGSALDTPGRWLGEGPG